MRERRVRVGGMVVSLAGQPRCPKCGTFAVSLCWIYYWTGHIAGRLRGDDESLFCVCHPNSSIEGA
jgi:hypothetical protein